MSALQKKSQVELKPESLVELHSPKIKSPNKAKDTFRLNDPDYDCASSNQ